MKHRQTYAYTPIDVGELLKIGGNATYSDGVLVFDNIDEKTDDMMSNSLLVKMLIKPKLDILVVCIEGELNYIIDSSSSVRLKKGQIAYFRQNQIVEHNGSHVTAKIILIAFPHEMTIGIREIDTDEIGLRTVLFNPSERVMETLCSVYDQLREVFDDNTISYRKEIIHSYVRIIMMQLSDTIRGERENFQPDANSSRPRREILLYNDFTHMVKEDYLQHRIVGHYAGRMCVSPEHLSRVVKNVSGKSASEWIRDYVVLEAKVLLKSTDMAVYQISDVLNFPNPSFFTKFFRKSTGMTPGAYREKDLAANQ